MNKQFILIAGTSLAGLAVALGAFGSHALKDFLANVGRTETFEIAVRYQMYHALAMLFTGLLMSDANKKAAMAGAFFFFGIMLFSGSLYVLCLRPIPGIVYLTPVGGFLFMTGWIFLLLHFLDNKKTA